MWLDYFDISNSENVADALDDYLYDDIDELGKQALRAMRNLQRKK